MKSLPNILIFLLKSLRTKGFTIFNALNIIFQFVLARKIIKYKYKQHQLFINNDSIPSVTYHILHSTPKIEKMISLVDQCKVAIDVGANNGLFSFFLKNKFPDAKVFVVEPSDVLIEVVKLNTKGFSNCYIEKRAISDTNGKLKFYINYNSEQTNSLDKESVVKGNVERLNKNISEVEVDSITLDKLCLDYSIEYIDVLKVDIQGAEHLLLKGASNSLKVVSKAFFEISFLDTSVFETADELRKYFKKFKVVNDVKMGADIMFYN